MHPPPAGDWCCPRAPEYATLDMQVAIRRYAEGARAELVAPVGGPRRGGPCGQESLRLATKMGMRPEVAHCHVGLGRFHRLGGDDVGARRHLELARTMFEEMGMRFWCTRAEAGLGL